MLIKIFYKFFNKLEPWGGVAGNPLPTDIINTGNGWSAPQVIFNNYYDTNLAGKPTRGGYRIPGIVATADGTLIATADKRYDGTTGNTDIVQGQDTIHKVHMSVKVSHDGGKTWSQEKLLHPEKQANDPDYKGFITDPQIVHNPDTGSTFVFGYQNNKGVAFTGGDWDFIFYKSDDNGKTWDKGTSIKNQLSYKGHTVPNGNGNQYDHILQGPGAGMYYSGKIYVPIQLWDNNGTFKSTAGFIYSEDNGKTWKESTLIAPEISNIDGSNVPNLSESNIFHHKGAVYLAAKNESAGGRDNNEKRVVYRTFDDGKTWERVHEDFLPPVNEMSKCQSSTFALNDDLYFVGFSKILNPSGWDGARNETWITTNTGYSFRLGHAVLKDQLQGYSSITSDGDTLYVSWEGIDNKDTPSHPLAATILLNKFDLAHKDYANLNAQIIDRARDQFTIQNAMQTDESFIKGSYGSENEYGVEAVVKFNKASFGLFHRNTKDNSKDIARTIAYDEKDTSVTVAVNDVILHNDILNDSFYAGYQISQVDYKNNAEDKVESALLGYKFTYKNEYFNYDFALNGMVSKHDFKRNHEEGLGKTSDFNSHSLSMRNEISKTFNLYDDYKLNIKPFMGFETIFFAHDEFSEENGNNFNDIKINDKSENSNQIYAGFNISSEFDLGNNIMLYLDTSAKLKKELSDNNKFKDSYQMFGERFEFASPIEDKSTIFEGSIGATIEFEKKFGLSIGYAVDTLDENYGYVSGKIKF